MSRFDQHGNSDLYGRTPEGMARGRDYPLAPGPGGAAQFSEIEGNAITFDFIGRFTYIAPPTSGVTFNLFTVTQTIAKGFLLELGIGSPQYDWFGTNEYYLGLNGTAPYNQQYQIAGGPGPTGSFFGFTAVGTIQRPKRIRVPVKTNDMVQLIVAPQGTPAAGTVVYNVHVRVGGAFYR